MEYIFLLKYLCAQSTYILLFFDVLLKNFSAVIFYEKKKHLA